MTAKRANKKFSFTAKVKRWGFDPTWATLKRRALADYPRDAFQLPKNIPDGAKVKVTIEVLNHDS